MSAKGVPTVDLSKYVHGSEAERTAFVHDLGKAFHEVGFVAVTNHGVPKSLVDGFFAASKAFFALPVEVKKGYEIEGMAGQRGYTSFGKEHAKQSKVADLKEFYQLGQEVPAGRANSDQYPENPQVAEVPDFVRLGRELYRAFENAGGHLLEAIAKHLNLSDDYFKNHIEEGNSILRAIHYPPITVAPASAIRAEQHEDINLITLLVGASAGGLQLLNSEGQWVNVTPEADDFVINVGDMLQRHTNNYL